jgi:transposase
MRRLSQKTGRIIEISLRPAQRHRQPAVQRRRKRGRRVAEAAAVVTIKDMATRGVAMSDGRSVNMRLT